jgi:GcrA cell cycle regulator
MAWTDELYEQVCEMWDAGVTARVIAEELGLTRNQIIGKMNRRRTKAQAEATERGQKFRVIRGGRDVTNHGKLTRPKAKLLPVVSLPASEPVYRKTAYKGSLLTAQLRREELEAASAQPLSPGKVNSKFKGVSILDLELGECRYPKGPLPAIGYVFCGQPVKHGSSYCPECHSVCWTPIIRGR